MLIAATSDIHSPRYLTQFFASFNLIRNLSIDIFLLAGDLANEGEYIHFKPVYDVLKRFRTIAVFGNEDFRENRDSYKETYPDIKWLEEDIVEFELGDILVSIIGSDGVLEEPTKWQKLNGIDENYYREKARKIEDLLCKARGDVKLLLTHYACTFMTVQGEKKSIFPHLGYRILEETSCLPHLAIHGHAHHSKVTQGLVRGVRVYNVALPANHKIVLIRL
ncbi:metallophosphoesterase family protein [Sulfolobus acidocaldarius]|uniref:Conserved protein n=4 Tax=Sulfolobus acidocaldarius TaxID=2285 RepID=Q4JBZ5_SULAC|nr:metallophosphoesterase [Sulfolobus acidocaldarius]AAY79684.1 conserved protein [Sulfolobus acidocaldarius DSM 639]AGE70243.1 hypothetical protein SacN8_01310 [Sulfolobus acidocaldarius N8]AGE72518.1 hypothetical protein SacRon12I_01310 [Sulfolobus acidocaldarius Ron12/I]ALU29352.1 metallophosphoesterase [Sulfolobus acidocaldarius]ALU32081.1 metallophosphoesterase [Sulfolobus acidocaldarius]